MSDALKRPGPPGGPMVGEQFLGGGGSWNPIVSLKGEGLGLGWRRRQWLWKMSNEEGRARLTHAGLCVRKDQLWGSHVMQV